MLASVETATLQGRRAIAAGVDAKVWVAAECNRYIFYRQVKPIACNSFPSLALFLSLQKIQPPPSLKSESIACNRQ
ncbi:hypothetical protein QUB33_01680 [Microcoleus sp. B3-A4]|uniref:hypothetical protein n=1 Tax=Microcoleus sp. B3-A4 TaxID=2818653 RepID=UPI002FD44E93